MFRGSIMKGSRYKLGLNGQKKHHEITKVQGINARTVNGNVSHAGFVPSILQQYSFLKSSPSSGESVLSPSSRPVVSALNRDLKLKLAESSNMIGTTRKQIRFNQHNNSGTSMPATTNFNYTTDYHALTGGGTGPYMGLGNLLDTGGDVYKTALFLAAGGLVFYFFFLRR